MENLRNWVISQGYSDILEYRVASPPRGRLKEREERRFFDDVKAGQFDRVYINSFEQAGLIDPMNVMLFIVWLKTSGVRLISREEPWSDLTDAELVLVYEAYRKHQEEELNEWRRTREKRLRRHIQ